MAHGQVPPARSELEGHEGGVGRQDKLNGSAQEALNQIKDKGCSKPYAAYSRKVIALGINFSSEKQYVNTQLLTILTVGIYRTHLKPLLIACSCKC